MYPEYDTVGDPFLQLLAAVRLIFWDEVAGGAAHGPAIQLPHRSPVRSVTGAERSTMVLWRLGGRPLAVHPVTTKKHMVRDK